VSSRTLTILNKDEGIKKLVDAKWTFILWPRKDIFVKTHSSLIVLPQSTEARGTHTSNMPKPAQNSYISDSSSGSRPSRPRAPGEHREKATFSYSRLSRPRALGQ
jgi:hypothetical protein